MDVLSRRGACFTRIQRHFFKDAFTETYFDSHWDLELANLFIDIFICIPKTENSKKVNMEYPSTRCAKAIWLQ